MTVAATIEAGTGGYAGPGTGLTGTPGKAPGRALGSGSGAAGSVSSAAMAGAQSFRSDWQAQLAALGGTENQGLEHAEDAPEDSSQGSEATAAGGLALPAAPARAQQGGVAAVAQKAAPFSRAGSVAGRARLAEGNAVDRTETAGSNRSESEQSKSTRPGGKGTDVPALGLNAEVAGLF